MPFRLPCQNSHASSPRGSGFYSEPCSKRCKFCDDGETPSNEVHVNPEAVDTECAAGMLADKLASSLAAIVYLDLRILYLGYVRHSDDGGTPHVHRIGNVRGVIQIPCRRSD